MKVFIRSLCVDDAPFKEFKGNTKIIGVVMRGRDLIEAVYSEPVEVDGLNSTKSLISMAKKTKQQVHCIITDGFAFGGFNIIDINKVSKETGLPVLAVTKSKARVPLVKKALEHSKHTKKKLELMKKAGPLYTFGAMKFHVAGTTLQKAKLMLKRVCKYSWPEGLRIAHIIAGGI